MNKEAQIGTANSTEKQGLKGHIGKARQEFLLFLGTNKDRLPLLFPGGSKKRS